MQESDLEYTVGNQAFKGFLITHEGLAKKPPAILIVPTWRGMDSFAINKARQVAKLGYTAFVADVFGNGKSAADEKEAFNFISPLFVDRKLLRERIQGSFEALKKSPFVDPDLIGAIGYCFGGLTVLELLRSGSPVKGVVSFHGVLGYHLADLAATPIPNAENIKASALILHGDEDPLVTEEDLLNLKNEFRKIRIDWQLIIYGGTAHSFTNPDAHDPENGMLYNPEVDKRSWSEMRLFFMNAFRGNV